MLRSSFPLPRALMNAQVADYTYSILLEYFIIIHYFFLNRLVQLLFIDPTWLILVTVNLLPKCTFGVNYILNKNNFF